MYKFLSGAYLFMFVGFAIANIGKEYIGGVYSELLPIKVLATIAFPMILGFFMGIEFKKAKEERDGNGL